MYEGGEDNHNNDGSRKRVTVGEDENHDSLKNEADCLPPKTSTHSHLGVGFVRDVSPNTTGEQVHPSEERGNCSGSLGVEKELLTEVEGGSVVHGELDSEAACVLDEKKPSVEVHGTSAEGSSGRHFSHSSVHLHVFVVTLGSIIRDLEDDETDRDTNNSRDDAYSPPCHLSRHTNLEKREETGSHDELGDTASKVTPSSDKSVGCSYNFLGKHTGGPVLTHNEGGSSKTDEETENCEVGCICHETGEGTWNGGRDEDDSHWNTGTVLITDGSIDETHEDSSSDRTNVGSPDLLLVKTKSDLHLRQERSDGEPDEERSEEAEPRAVEGTHVWPGEVAKLDFGSFVILVGVDSECVAVVLFPFGCARLNVSHDDCSSV